MGKKDEIMHQPITLLDSDFIIALFIADQSTHKKAKVLYTKIKHHDIYILNVTQFELATTISNKYSQNTAVAILSAMQKQPLHVLHITEETTNRIWEEWLIHTKKGTSFVDCANLVVAREMHANIASFDHFYPKEMRAS